MCVACLAVLAQLAVPIHNEPACSVGAQFTKRLIHVDVGFFFFP